MVKIIHDKVWAVVNPRLIVAIGLSAATLILFLAVIAAGGALRAGLAPWPGIGAILMTSVAFAVSKQKSLMVAGLLASGGLVGLVYGLADIDLQSVEFRGPIFGVIIGLPILGLGVAKGIEAAQG
jgi:hypothetical protein